MEKYLYKAQNWDEIYSIFGVKKRKCLAQQQQQSCRLEWKKYLRKTGEKIKTNKGLPNWISLDG